VTDLTSVSIVTGGARGIGRAVALALAAGGHAVCINDTGVALDGANPDSAIADAVADEVRAAGGRAVAVAINAATRAGAEAVLARAEAAFGERATVLVHAAGTLRDAMVHTATDDDWAEVLGSHLGVAVEMTRAMAPHLRAHRYGRIVYVGSAAGLIGTVGQAPYAVAKAGLFGLMRALALEMTGRDVGVNYVAPLASTRMTESIPARAEARGNYSGSTLSARAEDVAPVVAWLCSDSARGISGQVFGIRGSELALWSQPRPSFRMVEAGGWSPVALDNVRGQLEANVTPLESAFDFFGGPPPS
jgi:NAD(P)-dependent dehydrogenase (short-subunit alcohol dehydrogenase family)